jgi:fused signal recognition particle receptor
MGLLSFEKLKAGLKRTRENILGRVQKALSLKPILDEESLSQLEETLLTSDVGVTTTETLIHTLKSKAREAGERNPEQFTEILKAEMEALLFSNGQQETNLQFRERPHVIMVVGVNGVGKTTTVGKLAHIYRNSGNRVLIAAGDTFRAASNEQLEIWAERAGVRIIQQSRGSDPAAVAFDALKSAISNADDVVIIDTAGRLHTKVNLMEELKKVKRVLQKQLPEAPHEVLLVLDATTGQNAIQQAKQFTEALGVTGVILTKLDGTAKGGILFSISNDLKLPVKFIGLGEGIDDLQPFDRKEFVEALFAN